ncbi:NUDIX domain-containing protein, partial [Streptomyces sp. URMC 123]
MASVTVVGGAPQGRAGGQRETAEAAARREAAEEAGVAVGEVRCV